MVTKKKSKEVVTDVPATINLSPATLLQQDQKVDSSVGLPSFLRKEGMFSKEAPSGFSPQIDFEDEPGRWTIAKYLGTRHGIGPNASEMYDFEVVDGKGKSVIVSLWGATILDNKMRQLDPQSGQWVFIQYLGVLSTKRGLNPAKDYRLAIVNEKHLAEAMKEFKNQSA